MGHKEIQEQSWRVDKRSAIQELPAKHLTFLVHTSAYISWVLHNDTSYDGSRYWVVFVDDFTRMGWACAVKEKSEFTRCFKYFLDMYERPERRYYYPYVDQGGENCSD